MTRKNDTGVCEHCKKQFRYYLIHNGFNDSSYAYCEECGLTVIFSLWTVPKGVSLKPRQCIAQEIEPHIAQCRCGGAFRASAVPRCPHCRQPLSAVFASEYIERQAEGAKGGWRWQQTWTGLYCIIIEDRVARDIWNSHIV